MPKFGALDNSVIGSHTESEWNTRVEEQGFLCFYCGTPTCRNSTDPNCELTKDHLYPVSRGGVDFIWNIVAACFRCNCLKGTLLPGEFLKRLFGSAQAVGRFVKTSTGEYLLRGGVSGSDTSVAAGDIPVAIPFHKQRDPAGRETDGYGNYTEDHLEVAPFTAQAIRYLADKKSMDRSDEWYAKRRKQLNDQFQTVIRLRKESAGQLVLPIFGDSTARKLAQSESAALVFHGLDVNEREA